jgi:hypothetical protein
MPNQIRYGLSAEDRLKLSSELIYCLEQEEVSEAWGLVSLRSAGPILGCPDPRLSRAVESMAAEIRRVQSGAMTLPTDRAWYSSQAALLVLHAWIQAQRKAILNGDILDCAFDLSKQPAMQWLEWKAFIPLEPDLRIPKDIHLAPYPGNSGDQYLHHAKLTMIDDMKLDEQAGEMLRLFRIEQPPVMTPWPCLIIEGQMPVLTEYLGNPVHFFWRNDDSAMVPPQFKILYPLVQREIVGGILRQGKREAEFLCKVVGLHGERLRLAEVGESQGEAFAFALVPDWHTLERELEHTDRLPVVGRALSPKIEPDIDFFAWLASEPTKRAFLTAIDWMWEADETGRTATELLNRVTAIEALLSERTRTTDAVARRTAALLADTRTVDLAYRVVERVYALRSEIVHGRRTEVSEEVLRHVRLIARAVVIAAAGAAVEHDIEIIQAGLDARWYQEKYSPGDSDIYLGARATEVPAVDWETALLALKKEKAPG